MQLDIISYTDLVTENPSALQPLEQALLCKGIVGISHIPDFENKTREYIRAAQAFSALDIDIKQQYAPNRDAGQTEGYELGAEWFQTKDGRWQRDDKKASYYAFVPDRPVNMWPQEVDLRTAYLALGELIFQVGKRVLKTIGLDETIGLMHDHLTGYGRLLHYTQETAQAETPWCGAHFDHGIFTGLIPAYYFKDGVEVNEPAEAGLHIIPTGQSDFVKIPAQDKSILLFQVGEAGQLLSHDRIRATQHLVRKTAAGLERYAFALFFNAHKDYLIDSQSQLITDQRYQAHAHEGRVTYQQWEAASYERYRAR